MEKTIILIDQVKLPPWFLDCPSSCFKHTQSYTFPMRIYYQFIISSPVIQDPRVGITMYPVCPLPPWEKDGRQRRGRWSQFPSSQEMSLLPCGHPRLTFRLWGRRTCKHARTFTHGDITSFSGRSSGSSTSSSWSGSDWGSNCPKDSLVLDFGLDVFCHGADS